ncbi:oligosaccharide flippase family protein [Pareuzebyella sediminis]|uniref:oligosaccharide flippase family protein n=1 Tax=Pareuzebyella sediminis TaxID=2607998 RepID=UPI0021CFABB9|nr:oligosaccharide flippase family protein [Pareuzebyella sediminis]
MWSKFFSSEFSRNVSSQMLGTGLAQALPFLATPLLTRLFSEEDFALYTSFFAVASIFAVAVGGKYHLAIVLPKDERDANKIFVLSIYLTIAYALTIALILPWFHRFFPENLDSVLYYVPLYVLFFGIWSSYINVSIRHKSFVSNAVSKVLQAGGYIVAALVLGFSKVLAFGLVIAKIVGTVVSWIFLSQKTAGHFRFMGWSDLKGVATTYIDYPKYGIWPAFLNTISLQALILILTKFYSTDDLGYYGLTFMVLSAPLGLIGVSFKDVFYQKMADLMNQGRNPEALVFFKKSTLALFLMGLPIGIILFLWGEPLFGFVFGAKWVRSGEFASILAVSFVVKLVVSPLSSVFNATNTLRIASRWQVLYFITTFATLLCCALVFELNIIQLLMVYVAHEIILYGIYFLLQYRMIDQRST